MKSWFVAVPVIAGFCFSAALLCGADNASTKPDLARENEELRQRVTGLEARIKALEEKVGKFEAERKSAAIFTLRGATQFVPALRFESVLPEFPSRRPKIWGQGTCNGWTYYDIPLGGN